MGCTVHCACIKHTVMKQPHPPQSLRGSPPSLRRVGPVTLNHWSVSYCRWSPLSWKCRLTKKFLSSFCRSLSNFLGWIVGGISKCLGIYAQQTTNCIMMCTQKSITSIYNQEGEKEGEWWWRRGMGRAKVEEGWREKVGVEDEGGKSGDGLWSSF